MDNQDDDEQQSAYDRAGFDHETYIEFANIVQHFDETARPEHDDIDFNYDHEIDFDDIDIDSDQFDSTEYDHNGLPVTLYGVIIYNFAVAEDDYDFWDDIPHGYEPEEPYEYGKSHYRFPYSAPHQPSCKRPRATHYDRQHPGIPPI